MDYILLLLKIGPRNRPKYFYRFPYLTRIYLIIMTNPSPPPPPIARLKITSCGGKVDLGDDAIITASFNPVGSGKGEPWAGIYTKAEVAAGAIYLRLEKQRQSSTRRHIYRKLFR